MVSRVVVLSSLGSAFVSRFSARFRAMAVQITSSMTELKLVSGNGRPTAANFTAAGPDVPLALGAGHVLRAMSGGETTVTLRELEVAMFLAVYVDRERVGDTVLISSAWSLDSISAVFKSALQLGMETESRGSMRAALHYLVAFVREARLSSPDEFTFYRAMSFQALPPFAAPNNMGVEAVWAAHLTFRIGIDSGHDASTLAVLVNLLPDRYNARGRGSDDFLDAAGELYAEALFF